jgi:RNA polymerase sigma-70 factor (ECF subfamily)
MADLPNNEVLDHLAKIASGNEKASAILYSHYAGFLYAYIRHLLPDDDGAEEVCQDVFFSAFSKPDRFAGHARFSTWLCAIAKFKAADWWRRNRRNVPTVDVDDELLEQTGDPNWDFTETLSLEQDHEAMRLCIDRLKDKHREVIFSVYYESLGVADVAKVLDCPVGTVQTRLFHARKTLRSCIESWVKGGRYA